MVGERLRGHARAAAHERRLVRRTSPRSASPACCRRSCCSTTPGALLRPSIQQSDARCGAEVEELRAEIDEKAFLAKAGNGINQQLVAAKLRWIERHEPEIFARIATVFGSYDYINWRLTGERAIEQNWALEAGFVDLATHAIDDELVALAHSRAPPCRPRSLARNPRHVSVRARRKAGLRPGTPVVGGAADHIASALGAGVVSAGDVLLKFGGSVDILIATDQARPDPRLFLDYHLVPGPLRAQRLHGDRRLGAQLVRAPVRLPAKSRRRTRLASRSINGSTGSPRRGPPAATGLSSRRIFSARRRRSMTRTRARPSMASALARHRPSMARAARGLRLCDRASRRGHERDRLQDRALHRLRRRIDEPSLDADRRRRP